MVRGTRRCIRSSFGVETLGILSTYVQQANTCDPEDQERIRLHFTSTVDSYRSVICLGVGDMLHPANSTGPLLSAEKKHAEAGFLTCRTQERARRHFGTFCMNLRGGPPPPQLSRRPWFFPVNLGLCFSLLCSSVSHPVSDCSVPFRPGDCTAQCMAQDAHYSTPAGDPKHTKCRETETKTHSRVILYPENVNFANPPMSPHLMHFCVTSRDDPKKTSRTKGSSELKRETKKESGASQGVCTLPLCPETKQP